MKAAGCKQIFAEKFTRKAASDRKQLQALLAKIREGDVVVVTKIDRFARSTLDLLAILKDLEARGVGFKSLGDPMIERVNEGEVKLASVSFIKGSLGWSIERFLESDEWRGRSPITRKNQRFVLDHLKAKYGAGLWKELTQPDVKAIRVEITKAFSVATAKVALGLISTIWKFVDDYLDIAIPKSNPTAGVRRLYRTKKGHEPWPQHFMEAFDKVAPANLLLARKLLLYTGQRRSDVARMDWSQFNGATIEVRQQKTKELLEIPCHRVLREALEAIPADKRTGPIILNQYGNGYEPNGLSSAFRETFKQTGITGYTPHGLRVNAAEALAEAGCTPHQIMAITGHRTLAMVEHYTRKADQRKRARDAMRKWERSDRGTERETGTTGNKRWVRSGTTGLK